MERMNPKSWFIFKGDHHTGPFSTEEIRTKLHRGDLGAMDLLWLEGGPSWQRLSSYEDFAEQSDAPPVWESPEATPSFFDEEGEEVLEEVQSEEFIEEDEELPPVPDWIAPDESTVFLSEEDDRALTPALPSEEDEAISEWEEETAPSYAIEKKNKLRVNKKWLLATAVVFGVVLIALGAFALIPKEKTTNLAGLSPSSRETLTRFAEHVKPEPFSVRFAASDNGSTFFVASSLPGPAEVLIKMTSRPERVLSIGQVQAESESDLIGKFASFRDFRLIQGPELAFGEYDVELVVQFSSFVHKLKAAINETTAAPRRIFKGRALFFPGSATEFERHLKVFKDNVQKKKILPAKERLERLESMLGLLSRTKELYLRELKRAKTGKAMKAYERFYNREVGPVLRDLILDNNRIAVQSQNDAPDLSAAYEELANLGKDVGEIAANMATHSVRETRLDRKTKDRLQSRFVGEVDALSRKFQGRIRALTAEIAVLEGRSLQ
jgi:hypothetical protein